MLHRRNILTDDPSYLANCRYNKHDPQDKYCPIFRLGDIAAEAKENYTQLATYVSALLGCFPQTFLARLEKHF